ncbi:MAG: GerAB/ArcD/ProY family transporter [Firmicutes bacterium]|nr:GerAB/ArcD/ProY family transporter [Bacillota bacterium]
MIKEGRFGIFEGIVLLLFVTLGKIYLSYAADLIKENLSAAWLAVLLGSLVAFVWFLPLLALLNRFPGEDLIAIGHKVLRPIGSAFLVGSILLFVFFSAIIVLRQVGETIIGTALPQTPLVAILIVLAGIAALTARWGIEPTARVTALAAPYILAGGVFLFFLQLPNMNFDYLAPFWGPGWKKLLLNSFLRSSLQNEIILLGFLAPCLPRKKIAAIGFASLGLATVLLAAAMAVGQTIFPPAVAAEHTFPFYEIARSIYISRFFERLEMLFILVWLGFALLSLSVRFYISVAGLTKFLRLPYYQPLIPMAALLLLAGALLLPDYPTTIYLDNLFRGRWAWIPAFAFPSLLYLGSLRRGKKGEVRK